MSINIDSLSLVRTTEQLLDFEEANLIKKVEMNRLDGALC